MDIIQRLLTRADDSDNQELDREAAAEIERLRAVQTKLIALIEENWNDDMVGIAHEIANEQSAIPTIDTEHGPGEVAEAILEAARKPR